MDIVYRFADIPVRALYSHTYLLEQCRGYETDGEPLFTVEVTEQDLFEEEKRSPVSIIPSDTLKVWPFTVNLPPRHRV